MNTVKPATSLPWTFSPHQELDELRVFEIVNAGDTIADAWVHDDAAYIVTACNAYPRLLAENEKLKEALRHTLYFTEYGGPWHGPRGKIIRGVRTLLRELAE